MPQLSLIVPVYNVEEFIAECLDSILQQAGPDAEVVCVDDASTDGSLEIVRRYAEADPRVRLLRHEQNRGLGAARNTALDAAEGDYVMFVDSDDWLAEGALPAISQRLRETTPDVLIFDFARVDADGRVRLNRTVAPFEAPGAPVFTLAERPDVLDLLWIACSKAYRREFLNDLGLRFHEGYYEDVSWTFPCLMAAQRISLLHRVCYCYRRRAGAITSTPSRKHFDILQHYRHVFAFLDAHPELDMWRPVMHRQMGRHFLIALRVRGVRIPVEARGEFFAEASRIYRQLAPDAPPLPLRTRSDAIKIALLRRGWYRAFELFHRVFPLYRRLRRLPRRARNKLAGNRTTAGALPADLDLQDAATDDADPMDSARQVEDQVS